MTDKELFEKTEKTFNLRRKNNIVNKVFNEGNFNNVLNEMKNSKSSHGRRRRRNDTPSGLSTAVNSAAEGIGGTAKGIGKGLGKVFSSLNPFSRQKKLNKQKEIDRVHQNRMNRLDLLNKGQEMYNTGRTADTQYSKDKIDAKNKDNSASPAHPPSSPGAPGGSIPKDILVQIKALETNQKQQLLNIL